MKKQTPSTWKRCLILAIEVLLVAAMVVAIKFSDALSSDGEETLEKQQSEVVQPDITVDPTDVAHAAEIATYSSTPTYQRISTTVPVTLAPGDYDYTGETVEPPPIVVEEGSDDAEELPEDEEDDEPGISFTTTRLGGVEVHDYDPDADYSSLMNAALEEALTSANPEYALSMGEIYECQRNLKILDMGLDIEQTFNFTYPNTADEIYDLLHPPVAFYPYTQEELIALAKLVDGEAGWFFNTDEHQRAVASVVLNRALSPAWGGDNIIDVIRWPGQYAAKGHRTYTERSYANALYVLENGPITDGVFQAGFKQGTEVLMVFAYPEYSYLDAETTYICK